MLSACMSVVDPGLVTRTFALGSPEVRTCAASSRCAWVTAGHEADARVLQQQLSNLVSEQQAAQQYMIDNPPPPVLSHQVQQVQQKPDGQAAAGPSNVDWKWDILRPVSLPAEPK